MAVISESLIILKFKKRVCPFSSSKRITKVLNKLKWLIIGKVIYRRRNNWKIKITEDNIEQEKLKMIYIEDRESSIKLKK